MGTSDREEPAKDSNTGGHGEAAEPKSQGYLQHFQQPQLDFFCPALAGSRCLSSSFGVPASVPFTHHLFPSFPLSWFLLAAVRLTPCKITLPITPLLHRIYMPFIWSFYTLYSCFILCLFLL